MMTEVRVKLHIKLSNDPEVKNLWMCLDYDQKPTIEHVVNHVQKNLLDKKVNVSGCKLYLDNYWLPNYENSRLIRENDCIKVEVTCEEAPSKPEVSTIEKQATLNQSVLAHIKANEQRITEKQQQMENTYKGLSQKEIATVEDAATVKDLGYNHYFEHMTNNDLVDLGLGASIMPWNNNRVWEQKPEEAEVKKVKVVKSGPGKKLAKVQEQKVSKPKEATNCYRKFAIGSYAHMLDEPVQMPAQKKTNNNKGGNKKAEVVESDNISEEQLIDKYYDVLYNKKQLIGGNNGNEEFGKIAGNVKSSGQQKWKNSTQQTKTNGPKHIKFKSSDSSDSSSDDTEAENEQLVVVKPTSAPKLKVNLKSPAKKASEASSKYYEPTKEEQLDAVSYNRSYFVKNTKNLIEFKKAFNEDKLNAPQGEEFAYRPTTSENNQVSGKSKSKTEFNLNTSSSSNGSHTSVTSEKKCEKSLPKVCYDKYPHMVGAPRLDEKIAFQILEISSNFTPEVSEYKTGMVVEFDQETNEITLEMQNRYNQVLKKASKFSVILDETDQETVELEDVKPRRNSQGTENTLKVDWRNLMNLKLCPSEAEFAKQQEFATMEVKEQALSMHV